MLAPAAASFTPRLPRLHLSPDLAHMIDTTGPNRREWLIRYGIYVP